MPGGIGRGPRVFNAISAERRLGQISGKKRIDIKVFMPRQPIQLFLKLLPARPRLNIKDVGIYIIINDGQNTIPMPRKGTDSAAAAEIGTGTFSVMHTRLRRRELTKLLPEPVSRPVRDEHIRGKAPGTSRH
eukprot:6078977-Heterocapsa_arctica.AAC.1